LAKVREGGINHPITQLPRQKSYAAYADNADTTSNFPADNHPQKLAAAIIILNAGYPP